MWKPVVVAAAALAVAGSSIVYAQQHLAGPDRDGPRFEHRHRLSPEDRAAFVDARIAALKAGLELTPDQAKNWPDFEKALRDMAQLRAERIAAREAAQQNPDKAPSAPFDRLAQRADNMGKASTALKRIAETGKPLYASLDDAQKARFHELAWLLRPHHHWRARYLEGPEGHGWREGHDDGGPMWQHHWRHFGEDDGGQGGMHRMMDERAGTRSSDPSDITLAVWSMVASAKPEAAGLSLRLPHVCQIRIFRSGRWIAKFKGYNGVVKRSDAIPGLASIKREKD